MDHYLFEIEVAFAVSAFSLTVARTPLFEPVRAFMAARGKTIGYLFHCPYCLSHWLAAFFVFPSVDWGSGLRFALFSYVVNTMAVVGLSTLLTGAAYRLLHWDQEEMDDLRDRLDEAKQLITSLRAQLK